MNRGAQRRSALAIVGVLALANFAFAAPPQDSADEQSSGKPKTSALDLSDTFDSFAPMWEPLSHLVDDPKLEQALPTTDYAMLWSPDWQEDMRLTDAQKKTLREIGAQAVRDTDSFKRMSSKSLRAQIEAVLTPEQLQAFKEDRFAAHVVTELYAAAVRQTIGMSQAQEDGVRAVARQRLARVQTVRMKVSDQLWDLMTAEQKAALPEVVRRQGPTSAVLSVGYELGFCYDDFVLSYPMLAVAPARERLKLTQEQQQKLQMVMNDAAIRMKQLLQGNTKASDETKEERSVREILTPEQLATLAEIDFHRKVLLAMGYPEKQESINMTEGQKADFERLLRGAHQEICRIDREMVRKVARILTPPQREQLSLLMDPQSGK